MFSGFQASGFQVNAFQILIADNSNESLGDSAFIPSHQIENTQRKIKKAKNDIDRIDNVITELRRKTDIAAESRKLAIQSERLQRAIELQQAQSEYLQEIGRLLMVRERLIRQAKRDEELLIMMVVSRRRLRFAS